MKASLTTASLFLVFATVAASASAQTSTGSSLASPCFGVGDFGYGGYGYHASTFEEGVLRGRAMLAQGIGQANYYHSLAAINYQDAYSKAIKNRQQAINGYFYNQQANQAARDAKRSPRLSQEQYVALARNAAPDRLGERQYDRTFGRLEWPAALSNDEFTSEREELDRAFAERSPSESGASSKFYATVQKLTSKLQAKLKSQIDVLDPAQYMAAKNYLLSLNYEATQPVVNRALAAR